ncbi:hypothetical protein GMOD_00006241 [Pyrenophora seminiperda CCB06]|uniref:Uncharacterized protein n=1 Tax=Pyrenophora seminiperda CCB06 TaxID=1302712 RepID=A0A3M7M4M4_9PLEO|nr:hypothetical protein GMOD_00006241 [Pyrenophora seminiperda CCB06]
MEENRGEEEEEEEAEEATFPMICITLRSEYDKLKFNPPYLQRTKNSRNSHTCIIITPPTHYIVHT